VASSCLYASRGHSYQKSAFHDHMREPLQTRKNPLIINHHCQEPVFKHNRFRITIRTPPRQNLMTLSSMQATICCEATLYEKLTLHLSEDQKARSSILPHPLEGRISHVVNAKGGVWISLLTLAHIGETKPTSEPYGCLNGCRTLEILGAGDVAKALVIEKKAICPQIFEQE